MIPQISPAFQVYIGTPQSQSLPPILSHNLLAQFSGLFWIVRFTRTEHSLKEEPHFSHNQHIVLAAALSRNNQITSAPILFTTGSLPPQLSRQIAWVISVNSTQCKDYISSMYMRISRQAFSSHQRRSTLPPTKPMNQQCISFKKV